MPSGFDPEPACADCQDLGLVYVAEYLGWGKVQIALRPCFRCPAGWKRHGEPGKPCFLAERTGKACPYCGARAGGVVPLAFSGAEDRMPKNQTVLTLGEVALFQTGKMGDLAPRILARHGHSEDAA